LLSRGTARLGTRVHGRLGQHGKDGKACQSDQSRRKRCARFHEEFLRRYQSECFRLQVVRILKIPNYQIPYFQDRDAVTKLARDVAKTVPYSRIAERSFQVIDRQSFGSFVDGSGAIENPELGRNLFLIE
jgi:hypothetical protein